MVRPPEPAPPIGGGVEFSRAEEGRFLDYREVFSRLTGISTPFFGVSWSPPESEREAARRLIVYLEDRRVLFEPSEMEVPRYCLHSIMEIRQRLTDGLGRVSDEESVLAESLRAMRAACRKFLRQLGDPRVVEFGGRDGHWASWEFNGALGELRNGFGTHLARLVVAYGLTIEDDLARILPGADED